MHTREEQLKAFDRLLTVMDELREKCPWDRKQTFESLRQNTIEETYELASPDVVLWPTADYEFERNTTRDVNAHLLAMTCVKEHIIAGVHGTRKFTLPYTVGTSEQIDLPKI